MLPTQPDQALNSDHIAIDMPNDGDNETAPLLSSTKQQISWLSWAGTKIKQAAIYTGNGILYAIHHPISTATAIITAAPTALNALAAPSHQGPDKIGSAWWNGMTSLTKTHSIVNAASSLTVNAIMNALFLPLAFNKFRTNIKHLFDGPREFVDNSLSIILGLSGAIAAAAIAYNAFLWLPLGEYTAVIPALFNFTVTAASRYLGVKNVFSRVYHFFSENAALQSQYTEALEHISPTHLNQIEAEFRQKLIDLFADHDPSTPLTEAEYEALTQSFVQKLYELKSSHPDLIQQKTTTEYAAHYAATLFDLTFAVLALTPASFLTHMQKGYDGVELIKKLSTGDLFTNLSDGAKRGIGTLPGLASALMYCNAGIDFRETMTDLAKCLYQNPQQIPFALLLLTANGFSTSGMQNVAAGIVAKRNNITGMKDNEIGTTFVVLTALGGGVVNTVSSLKKAYPDIPPVKDLTFKQYIHYIRQTHNHPIHHQTAETLRDNPLSPSRIQPDVPENQPADPVATMSWA